MSEGFDSPDTNPLPNRDALNTSDQVVVTTLKPPTWLKGRYTAPGDYHCLLDYTCGCRASRIFTTFGKAAVVKAIEKEVLSACPNHKPPVKTLGSREEATRLGLAALRAKKDVWVELLSNDYFRSLSRSTKNDLLEETRSRYSKLLKTEEKVTTAWRAENLAKTLSRTARSQEIDRAVVEAVATLSTSTASSKVHVAATVVAKLTGLALSSCQNSLKRLIKAGSLAELSSGSSWSQAGSHSASAKLVKLVVTDSSFIGEDLLPVIPTSTSDLERAKVQEAVAEVKRDREAKNKEYSAKLKKLHEKRPLESFFSTSEPKAQPKTLPKKVNLRTLVGERLKTKDPVENVRWWDLQIDKLKNVGMSQLRASTLLSRYVGELRREKSQDLGGSSG